MQAPKRGVTGRFLQSLCSSVVLDPSMPLIMHAGSKMVDKGCESFLHLNHQLRKFCSTHFFTYLGSIMTSACDLTAEIKHRVNLASTSFVRLSKRVFTNRDLSTRTKSAVYNAICVSTLLYACEGWTLYHCHIRVLKAFYIWCLQTILHAYWWDKISHVEICRRAGTTCLETILLRRQLRWLGHVIRMPGSRLP